jgi:DNA-directed RNA polymerase specialized sigma24 family protein
VNRFGRLVLHTASKIGLNHSDAADVAQLTWLRLLEHGQQIRESDRLPAWLVSTARREAIRVAVASRRYVLCADPTGEYSAGQGATNDVYPVDGDYEPAAEQALGRLPSRYQTLLRLLTSDRGLSYSEIATEMEVPIGSIGPMRMRALRMLENTPEFKSAERTISPAAPPRRSPSGTRRPVPGRSQIHRASARHPLSVPQLCHTRQTAPATGTTDYAGGSRDAYR